MYRSIYICILVVFSDVYTTFADLRDSIIPTQNPGVLSGGTSTQGGTSLLDAILAYIRDSLFGLMALVAIGVFLWIGGRFLVARGNPEEFKKAWLQFLYAVIGIFIVAFAWAAIRLVVGLNF
jgi:uncharacterized membrane protein YqgA involved in biofilm formation